MPRDQWQQANLKSRYGSDAYEKQQDQEAAEDDAQAALITQLQREREEAKKAKRLKPRRKRGHTR